MKNITPLAEKSPAEVKTEKYELLNTRKTKGWTNCDSKEEWLVKLHYLRQGFREGKIAEQQFKEKERSLVLKWWRKWC